MTEQRSRLLSGLTALTIATTLASSNTFAQSGSRSSVQSGTMRKGTISSGATRTRTTATSTPVGLSGYCPVCVIMKKKWEKGDSRIASTYDGVTYYFPSKSIQRMFDSTPEKFVPALNGDCIVCYEKMGKRVPGSIRHVALHKSRLYLFPSEREKAVFTKNSRMFEDTDLAAKGECIVCFAKMGKHVPGAAKHTVIHNGFRYLFPSAAEAGMFRKTPEKFVTMAQDMEKKSMMKTSLRGDHDDNVRVTGRSGCAGCEFGVTPLSAPDELGLAIVGTDGQVTVVEDAHKQYPGIYKARFDGRQLVAEGTVLKTDGRISWVRPTSLRVVN